MAAEPSYHQFTLANGLRVVAVQRADSKRFAASLAFQAGWRNDPPRLDGLAHLVEHLVMAGPNAPIIEDLTRRGAYLNGETGWEKTRFSAMAHISLFRDCLGMFANVLTCVASESKAFLNEMQIIKHEYLARARIDSYTDLSMQRLWGPILGDKRAVRPGWKNVKRLQRSAREHVEPFHHSFYRPSNACLAVVSPLDSRELETQLEASLSAKEAAEEPAYPTARSDYGAVPPLVLLRWGSVQTAVQVLFHFHPIERYPLSAVGLLADVLGGGPHSALFRTLRQEHRFAYNVSSSMVAYTDCAVLGTYALVQRRSVRPTLECILMEINRLRTEGLQPEVFDDARLRSIQKFEMLEDEWLPLANFITLEARGPAAGPIPTPETYRAQLRTLDLAQFNQVAREMLASPNRVVALSGMVGLLKKWRIKRLLKSS